jgi:hypothetical protein
VILAVLGGHLDVVLDAVGPNFRGVVGGSPEGGLLWHAAWVGDAGLVRELLARGADPGAGNDTALAWAAHGSHGGPGRDYVAVAELLVGAGNVPEQRHLEVADGPLYDWLEERLA